MTAETSRRPLKVRERTWPRQLAFALVRRGLTPNQISVASAVISAIGAAALWLAGRWSDGRESIAFLISAVCIQLRLVCNLLDGLMAVEGGLKTKSGEIFNEFPDRVADVLLLVCAGYSVARNVGWTVELGYLCAIASVITAYVRVFGGAAGLTQDYCGPMAKQQRMATLTIACVLSAAETLLHQPNRVMWLALVVILVGSLFTAARRTVRISRLLNAQ
ncbi:MAG: CDP-alcohol phosphatidyltransferase family protein [Chthoniobacterales bacterium]